MIRIETSTKSTTALPRSPSMSGPGSANAGDRVQRVRHRLHDRLAERDEDGQHQRRRHHGDHHPARDVAPLGIVAAHPVRHGGQGILQVGVGPQGASFLLGPPAHWASETMLISPGKRAKPRGSKEGVPFDTSLEMLMTSTKPLPDVRRAAAYGRISE